MGLCPETPETPDYAEAARQAVYADLETYPTRYLVDAAARSGQRVSVGGKEYDFTGLGQADTVGAMSDQMAQTLLEIQRGMGPQLIEQRLRQLQQADPEGYAARRQLFDQIVADAKANPDRPIAENLQQSIVGELQNAGRLDAKQTQEVQNQVRNSQVGKGNYLGNAAIAQEARGVVGASEQQRSKQQAQALDFLNSGVTPEDIEYRRMQQAIGNLTNFANSTTPTAQFQGLSGAGNQSVPFWGGGQSNVVTNPNAAQQGANNALGIYSNQLNWSNQQANPWLAGISTGASTFGAMQRMR